MSAPHQQGDTFGLASLTPAQLAEITSAALGRAIRPAGMRVIPIPYDWGSPATAGLWRVDVSDESAQAPGQDDQAPGPLSYTYFVKLLRHPRRWPGLVHLPDQASRDEFAGFFPWRFELDMYECGIGAVLPAGMRTPRLHHVRRTDEDHLGLWWEFVPERPASWDQADYRRAAFLLARLAARRREGADVNPLLPPVSRQPHPSGTSLRYFTERRVLRGVLPALRAGRIWDPPSPAPPCASQGTQRCRPTCWHSPTGCPGCSTCWTGCRRPTRTVTQARRTSCCRRRAMALTQQSP